MAIDPRALDQYGTPFWVHFDLATAAGTTTLVTPKSVVTQPTPIAGGPAYELGGLVVTGIHYHIHAGTNNDGFKLEIVDEQINTASDTVLTLFHATGHTNDLVSANSISCFLPLQRAGLPLNTPSAGVQNGSSIRITNTNGGSCTGSVIVEGFHTTHSFGRYAGTGSPQSFESPNG